MFVEEPVASPQIVQMLVTGNVRFLEPRQSTIRSVSVIERPPVMVRASSNTDLNTRILSNVPTRLMRISGMFFKGLSKADFIYRVLFGKERDKRALENSQIDDSAADRLKNKIEMIKDREVEFRSLRTSH